jgi:hypothetical protein
MNKTTIYKCKKGNRSLKRINCYIEVSILNKLDKKLKENSDKISRSNYIENSIQFLLNSQSNEGVI